MTMTENMDVVLRFGVFVALLVLLLAAEAVWPRKTRVQTRSQRWTTNFAILIIDSLALRVLGPLTAMAAAYWASGKNIGVLNLVELPVWLEFVIAIIVLDLVIYVQHVLTHKIPVLWRLHKVHHADRDIDTSTALRFHPVEIILSMLYKIIWVIVLGPAAFAVLIFEVLLNGCAMFNHANLRLPLWLDRTLRLVLVTPDMHRVHHSVRPKETHSNYGFFLPWWDRMFRTYKAQPEDGHDDMTIGLPPYQDEKPAALLWSLKLPFLR